MGYFSLCLKDTVEARLKNIVVNAGLMLKAQDCDYLISFIKTDLEQIEKLLENDSSTSDKGAK